MALKTDTVKLRLIASPETTQTALAFLAKTGAVVYKSNLQRSRHGVGEVLVYLMLRVGENVPCMLCGELGNWLAHHDHFICDNCRFEVW